MARAGWHEWWDGLSCYASALLWIHVALAVPIPMCARTDHHGPIGRLSQASTSTLPP